MSETDTLLRELGHRGIELRAVGGELHVDGPSHEPTPGLRARLLAAKPALLLRLGGASSHHASAGFTVGQEALWHRHHAHPRACYYNVPRAFRLTGPLDPVRLASALSACVRRHPALRLNAVPDPSGPRAVLKPHHSFAPTVTDLSTHPDPPAAAQTLLREEAARPFDLEHDCLLRCTLARLGPDEWMLLATAHHLAADCWSMGYAFQSVADPSDLWHPGLFFEELWADYFDPDHEHAPLACAPDADPATWQQHLLASPEGARLRDFSTPLWREAADGLLFGPRKAHDSTGERLAFHFPPGLSERLRTGSPALGVSLPALFLTATHILLHRWKGADRLHIGMPTANRRDPALRGRVGNLGNNILIPARLDPGMPFSTVLRHTQAALLDAVDHQDYPIEWLQRDHDPEGRLPECRFILQSPRSPRQLGGGLEIEPVPVERGLSKHPLTLVVVEQPAGFRGWAEFLHNTLDRTACTRLLGAWFDILELGLQAPETRVAGFPAPRM